MVHFLCVTNGYCMCQQGEGRGLVYINVHGKVKLLPQSQGPRGIGNCIWKHLEAFGEDILRALCLKGKTVSRQHWIEGGRSNKVGGFAVFPLLHSYSIFSAVVLKQSLQRPWERFHPLFSCSLSWWLRLCCELSVCSPFHKCEWDYDH